MPTRLKASFLFTCLIIASNLLAQSNYIVVGQKDSMIYTQFVPPLLICTGCIDPYIIRPEAISVDLNHDGINDVTIYPTVKGYQGGGGYMYNSAAMQVELTSNCSISCGTFGWYYAFYPYYNGDACDYGTATIGRTYQLGDTLSLDSSIVWQDSIRGIDTCMALDNSVGDYCLLIDSSSIMSDSVYYCFRLINSGDTLLGYLLVSDFTTGGGYNSPTASFYINCFAIQGHPEVDTIDGIKGVNSIPDIRVFPVPFIDVIHIRSDEPFAYSLYDMNGSVIKSGAGSDIDTRFLSTGVYVLELRNGNGVVVKKVVKTE